MNELWAQILAWLLGGGAIGSIVTYIINRPRERNKFLAELQGSIDLLSSKNAELLREVTQLNGEVYSII